MIRFTQHAVQRFVEHWRPGMSCEQAEGTLVRLIASAAHTRINARGGSARIHVAETERGERIFLVVRRGWVVTVLPRRSWEDDALASRTRRQDGGAGEGAHPATDPRAALMASLFEDATAARREKAERILESFRAGVLDSSAEATGAVTAISGARTTTVSPLRLRKSMLQRARTRQPAVWVTNALYAVDPTPVSYTSAPGRSPETTHSAPLPLTCHCADACGTPPLRMLGGT